MDLFPEINLLSYHVFEGRVQSGADPARGGSRNLMSEDVVPLSIYY